MPCVSAYRKKADTNDFATAFACSNEDDLTVKLGEIVFANQLIKTGLAKGVTTTNLIVRPDSPSHALLPLHRS